MTKLRVMSDLHLEFEEFSIPCMEDDKNTILILAGDIVIVKNIEEYKYFFDDISERFRSVVVIMGNHEHYRGLFNTTYKKYKEFLYLNKYPNIFLLEKESVDFGDIVVAGATLWTDMDDSNPLTMMDASRRMNDYNVIKYLYEGGYNKLRPEITVSHHRRTVSFLEEFIDKYRDTKKVVVLHHAPSENSVHELYKGDPLNHIYYSSLENLFEFSGVNLVVHGHMHNNSEYDIGYTKVVCNPKGYNDQNSYFNPYLLLEV